MKYAYSILAIKSLEDGASHVVVEGIATTPQTDRAGDIVDPLGVQFKNPMPLLWQHSHGAPVGQVNFGKPTKEGIPFQAAIPIVKEAGRVKDRVDEAIHSLKYSLVSAVSIGFRALEDGVERLKEGGLRFLKTEVMELSLVTIPANSQAVITAVKAASAAARTAEKPNPGVSGKEGVAFRKAVSIIPKGK